MIKAKILGIGLPLLAVAMLAHASTISFSTASGAIEPSTNLAVSASGTITTNANGTVTVTLADTMANPSAAGQLLSDLLFTLSAAPTTSLSASVIPTGAGLINIDSSGNVTSSADTVLGWAVSNSGSTIHLDSLAGGPSQTLIGPAGPGGVYTNANPSITGTTHNPFLTGTATFTFAVGGVTDATTISAPIFSFGTDTGDNVDGCIVGAAACTSSTVPEPVSLSLVGGGLLALGLLRKRLPRQ